MRIGERANKRCPVCRGSLQEGLANIPFLFEHTIIIVKEAPAEICSDCHEPFLAGHATDRVMTLLQQLKRLPSEVSVVTYTDPVKV